MHGDKDNDIQVDGGPLEGKLLQTGSKTLKKVLADLKRRKKTEAKIILTLPERTETTVPIPSTAMKA